MKRIFLLLLVALLTVVPVLTMVACESTPDAPPADTDTPSDPGSEQPGDGPDTEQPGDEPSADSETIALVADGVAQYRIVRSDFANATVKALAIDLRNAIETITGVKPELVTDFTDEKDNTDIKEILVGKTNRPESAELSAKLGGNHYGYAVIGNKLVFAGNSDALLGFAITSFLKDRAGYVSEGSYMKIPNLSISKTLSVIQTNDHTRDVAIYTAKESVAYLDELQKALSGVAGSVTMKNQNDDAASVFDSKQYGLVVIVGADTLPAEIAEPMSTYLNVGGRVLFLGGPTFYNTVKYYEYDGEQLTAGECAQLISDELGKGDYSLLLDTEKAAAQSSGSRTTQDSSTSHEVKVGNYGLAGTAAQFYHATSVSTTNTWDMMAFNTSVTVKDANVLLVQAKPGNETTTHFSIELWEKDGSRWYGNIVFENDDWATYMLAETDFTYFQGGTKKDALNFNNVSKMQVGYATSFYEIGDTKYAYYMSRPLICHVDDFSAKTTDFELTLDGIAPLYEQYPITNAKKLVTEEDQAFISERDYVVPASLFSCHPGRQGAGFDKRAESRFIPLIRVTDEKGLHSGYAAWVQLFSSAAPEANGALEGTMVGCFSASSDDFYNADGIAAITEVVEAMTRNTFIVDGGATEYLYVEDDTDEMIYGINYVTYNGGSIEGLTFNVSLYRDNTLLSELAANVSNKNTGTNGIKSVKGTYDLSKGAPNRAVATLEKDGKVIDMVEHTIRFWSPKPADELSFVYVEDGYFKRDGKIVNFFGVNYLPSYNVANYPQENANGSYYNLYCADAAYDPEVISYDLARIKDLGMNAISFSCNGVTNNLLDLILQCEDLGIYIDLSINGRGAYPLSGFGADAAIEALTSRYLDRIDSIIAYDIAWEPRIGAYDASSSNRTGRKQWDDEFTAWVKVQYGSVDAAETAWGVKADRSGNNLVVTDAMLDDTTGKYRALVAAYYRFLDDQISIEMTKISDITSVLPNQLFSFRMSMSGSALRTSNFKPSTHCFDFQSLASSMAFMQPEGYQLTANTGNITDETAAQISFVNAYARYTQPDSPVVWKEFGKSVWAGGERGNFAAKAANQKAAETYYRYVMEHCYESYTSGMFAWFYSGGYRVGENSDYGILNPDGSDRPLTALLREYAPLFINQGEREESDVVYIEVERDDYIGGIFGMFQAVKSELAKAHKDGKHVVFVNATQDENGGYAYADEVCTEAVGGTEKVGTYPLRYVNGLVKSFETYTEGGKTYAKVVVCNTKQSVWREGTVSLVSTNASGAKVDYTIDTEVGYLEDVELTVPVTGSGSLELRFEVKGMQFGPLYSTNVK